MGFESWYVGCSGGVWSFKVCGVCVMEAVFGTGVGGAFGCWQ